VAEATDFDLALARSRSGLPFDLLNITLWTGWTSDLRWQKMLHCRRLLLQWALCLPPRLLRLSLSLRAQEPRGKGELLEQKRRRRNGRRVGVAYRRRRELREIRRERIEFMIIIIIGNVTILSNSLKITIAFPMFREPVRNLLQVIFLILFLLLYIFKKMNYL